MRITEKLKQNENKIWALSFSLLLCILLSIRFDFYYDLNDDVLMKDILAGAYTGQPESRNIQMLFPISWFLSGLYRLVRTLPWYGIFICGCQFFCIYLLTERLLGFFSKKWSKAAAVSLEALVLLALILWELIFVQYTVTCTLLAATAAFLFLTTDSSGTAGAFLRRNLPSVFLVALSYLIRSEMLLLVLPLICVTGLCRWMADKPFWTKENAKKYFLVFGVLLSGIILGQSVHMLGYSSPKWREFTVYFDNRTELYDFQFVPAYEGNEAFYESVGMSKSGQTLLANYNFGMDEEINAELLGKVADYAGEIKKEMLSSRDRFKQAVSNYRYRTFHETDYPWNLFVLGMYAIVLVSALWNRHFRYILELFLLGMVRTGLWMFILYRGRSPERITHSLYLMEFVILLGMLLWESKKENRLPLPVKAGIMAFLAVLGLLGIGGSFQKTWTEYLRREQVNTELQALQSYTRQYLENFYFVDVYSTVAYSEKMFADVDNSLSNYDIMGGWASKSPLNEKKFRAFHIDTMEEAILTMENVYVIVKEPEPNLPLLEDWMRDYYGERGISVTLQKVDVIRTAEKEVFYVYTVRDEAGASVESD
ncbi:MAG: hypothetical protein J1E83_06835 [Lachnospiraceae bacterium]|nr:hypothetical protein [Lachnospiraceae bacterium]